MVLSWETPGGHWGKSQKSQGQPASREYRTDAPSCSAMSTLRPTSPNVYLSGYGLSCDGIQCSFVNGYINISRNLQPLSSGLKWFDYSATALCSRFVLRTYSVRISAQRPVFLTHDFVLSRISPYFSVAILIPVSVQGPLWHLVTWDIYPEMGAPRCERVPRSTEEGCIYLNLQEISSVSRQIILRAKNVSKSCRGNWDTHFICDTFFPRVLQFYRQ